MTEQTTDETTEQVPQVGHVDDEQAPVTGVTPEDEQVENLSTPQTPETPEEGASPDAPESHDSPDDDPDTFPREYVERLRDENAKYRQRAAERDDLAQRLHTALVAATGRLHDPDDLPFEDAHLTDPEALDAAVEDLLARKPHLAARKPSGDVGQGATSAGESVDLMGMLRSRA